VNILVYLQDCIKQTLADSVSGHLWQQLLAG